MTPRERYRVLTELKAHPGWSEYMAILQEEMVKAARALASEQYNGHQSTVDYQRGMLAAIERGPGALDAHIAILEADLTVAKAIENQEQQDD